LKMKRDLVVTGFLGSLVAVVVYLAVSAVSARLPLLVQETVGVAIAFGFLLILSLVEIPIMVFGLRQMVRSSSTPRRLILATFAFYVMFASVYASIFVLLTGQILWGAALAALCLVRFASGMMVR
jgi:hypothetical protein